MLKRRFSHPLVAVLVLASMLVQGTWVLAGTVGNLNGTVVDTTGAPVVAAKVTAVSPSQISSATTDNAGHFTMFNLSPDTYLISAEKAGYDPVSISGITVIADQNITVNLTQRRTLREIGRVTARSESDIVRPGITTDIYSVNAAAAEKAAVLGGGGSLNSAYSAIASVPGLALPMGQTGWNQSLYIRGAAADTTGYEYDGVPVNRAFDNYAAHTASNLGQQQLQVYTGGGPASSSSAGISGFINTVIKTGTYPGFATADFGIAGPSFYHKAGFEFGGATPSRNFSYYIGVSGYNQSFRYGDQTNGAGLAGPNGVFGSFSAITNHTFTGQGVNGICDSTGTPPAAELAAYANNPSSPAGPGCLVPWNGFLANFISDITDRENVVNLHFGLPRRNGLKDDIQVLYSASALRSLYYSSPNDMGPGVAQWYLANTGGVYNPSLNDPSTQTFGFPHYIDAFVFNAPFGTPVKGLQPIQYFQPSSPNNRPLFAPLPLDNKDLFNNDTGIVKLSYTHNLSDHAYARLFGYTFFSDWTQAGSNYSWLADNFGIGTTVVAQNYDLITHTGGLSFQLADQVNDKNLVQLNSDYVRANVVRFNNTGFLGVQPSTSGLVSKDSTGRYHCWEAESQTEVPCSGGGWTGNGNIYPQYAGNALNPFDRTNGTVSGAAAAAGAQWMTIWDGGADGTYNRVGPRFFSVALTDQFKPTAKLTFNGGLRFDQFGYKLSNTVRPANDFYTQVVQQYVCYDPQTDTVQLAPLGPTTPPPPPLLYTSGPCQPQLVGGVMHQFVHPDGTVQNGVASTKFTDSSPGVYTLDYLSPRFSVAYAQSPDTVFRFSAGRFVEPPISAAVQYDRFAGRAATTLLANAFIPLGFFSPFHAINGQSATNIDASLERHMRGTDISFKLTPYYRYTTNWSQDHLIGQNFVTHIPVGDGRDYGVEFQVTKGDFNRNGYSGQVSYTYTNSKVRYKDITGPGTGEISRLNQLIGNYNALTTSAKCYTPAVATSSGGLTPGSPDPSCAKGDILNPYFGQPAQGLLDPSGWYAPSSIDLAFTGSNDINNYTYPHVLVGILSYRHDRLAVTPSIQFNTGSFYGSPTTVQGYDPRICTANSATNGIKTAPNPLQADYTTCNAPAITSNGALFIPNPETGHFDNIGQYQNPSILTGNLAISYDLTKQTKANLLFSNVFHQCFGGTSTRWSTQFAPGQSTCAYFVNGLYPANFYNGSGPNDLVANGVAPVPILSHPYLPTYGNQPFPFNMYFTMSFKM